MLSRVIPILNNKLSIWIILNLLVSHVANFIERIEINVIHYKKQLHNEIKDKFFYEKDKHKILDKDRLMIQGLWTEEDILPIFSFDLQNMMMDYLNIEKQDYEFTSVYMSRRKIRLNYYSEALGNLLNNYVRMNPNLAKVVDLLIRYSNNSCLVGGAIRDIIKFLADTQSLDLKDWDFVTDIPYEELIKIFKDEGFEVKETGKNFLVINVKIGDDTFEIANYRKDGIYLNGRRPDSVEIGTLEEDARRRDFTINAIYFNLTNRQVIDPTGQGLDDALYQQLRFIGFPKDRLTEDYLRAFRFYRFISKGYTPIDSSLREVRAKFETCVKNTSPHRIMMEIERMIHI